MISCKQSTEFIIQKERGTLSIAKNLQLLSHLAICSFCRLFAQQSALLEKALSKNNEEAEVLTRLEKEELLRSIQAHINR